MTRRPELEHDYRQWLAQVGQRMRRIRSDRGWTQSDAADRSGIDYKYCQAIEAGRASVSARTLFLLSRTLGVSPAALLATNEADSGGEQDEGPYAALRHAGWQVFLEHAEDRRGYVPVVAHAPEGKFTEPVAWASPPTALRQKGLFLVQVSDSATWALCKPHGRGQMLGKTVLLQTHRDARPVVLRAVGLRMAAPGGRMRIELMSVGKDVAANEIEVHDEAQLRILGEVVLIVGPHEISQPAR